MSEFSFSPGLALELFNSTEEFPVDFDVAWSWLDYSRKDVAKRNFLRCNFLEGTDYRSFRTIAEREVGATVTEKMLLTVDCLKVWAMMANTEQGRLVRQYFLECERIAKQHVSKPRALPEVTEETVKTYMHGIELLTNSGDLRLAQLLKNQFGNTLLSSQQRSISGDITDDSEGAVDVAIRLGFRVPGNLEGSLGRHVKSRCSDLIKGRENRYSNASAKQVPARMYPSFCPEVEDAVINYCTTKGIKRSHITLIS